MGDVEETSRSPAAGTFGYGKEEMMDSKDGFRYTETSSQDNDVGRKPFVGMKFESEDAARIFYAAYARCIGFGINIGQCSRSDPDGPIISWDFSCSREGFKRKNVGGCNAMLKIERKNSDIWMVTKFVEEHNHSTNLSNSHNLRPCKNFAAGTNNAMKKVNTVDDVYVSAGRNHSYRQPSHGSRNASPPKANHHSRSIGWTYYVRPCKPRRTLGKDAQSLLDYFKRKQAESPGFFYAVQLDDENHMTNVFWVDARSRTAYTHFGDAVIFDTTYRTSIYQVPFAPFTGLNHHGQMVLFGCALILDESETSFIWLFKTWLLAMNDRPPLSITTDQDRTIQAAVSQVLPQTRHCICRWHILREGQERLAHVCLAHPSFYGELYSCINFSETIEDFESAWCSLLDKYNLQKNEWLGAVYNARRQWAPVFFRDSFFASISLNQGIKTFFDGYVNQQTTLPLFFKQYEKALADSLEREIEADYESIHTNPLLKTPSPMEQQVADQYTRKIFVKFQEELVETFAYAANRFEGDEMISKYRVTKYEHDHKAYIVTVNVSDMKANCSCHMFEYEGILCRHVLTVFTVTNVLTVPSHYILKRWTKTAKAAIGLNEHNQSANLVGIDALTLRFARLCQEAIKFAEEGSIAFETYNVALSALRDGAEKMALMKKNTVKVTPLGPQGIPTNQEKSNFKSSLSMPELTPPSLWPLQETAPRRFNLNDAGVAVADLNHASMTPLSGQQDGNPLDNMEVVTCFKSMAWVIESNNCTTVSAKVAVIDLKLQDPKTSSGETELKFRVSRDNLASMLGSMTSLHQQL